MSRHSPDVDAVIVGAGFSGLLALHRLRQIGLSGSVFEQGGGLGGTWYWNRYPGARCDVESFDYSYQFSEELEQEWEWSERYATQLELLRYLEHVAERFDLKRDIRFGSRVEAAEYDDATALWTVRIAGGEETTARWLLMGTGCLSSPSRPPFAGEASFRGAIHHTGRWPHDGVDFAGKRVGVIGTGSSGVQAIPLIAEQAAHLTVFQRTANYCAPAHNRPLTAEDQHRVKSDYRGFRARSNNAKGGTQVHASPVKTVDVDYAERRRVYAERWEMGGLHFQAGFADTMTSMAANDAIAEFVRDKIRAIVHDPATADLLSPRQPLGCKRLCVDTGYYATFNRDNVTLVDVRSAPVTELTPTGLRTNDADYAFDIIIFATGYDAMTGALAAIDIRGRDGLSLREAWSTGPRSYLGLAVAGFPNLFIIAGPGSPSVLTNVAASIEQQVDWITRSIAWQIDHVVVAFEAEEYAQDAWVDTVNGIANHTLFPGCNSWYLGANIPGKTRVFMPYAGGLPAYRSICDSVSANGYEGFSARIDVERAAV